MDYLKIVGIVTALIGTGGLVGLIAYWIAPAAVRLADRRKTVEVDNKADIDIRNQFLELQQKLTGEWDKRSADLVKRIEDLERAEKASVRRERFTINRLGRIAHAYDDLLDNFRLMCRMLNNGEKVPEAFTVGFELKPNSSKIMSEADTYTSQELEIEKGAKANE